jgi:PKD repeat protein
MARHAISPTNLHSITRTLIPVIYSLLLLFFIWPASGASAGSATLTWNPPIDTPDIDGYTVYYGQVSRHAAGFSNYEYSEFAGNTRSYGIEGLEEGTIYYFAVTTMGSSGNESTYSNEVCCTISGSNGNQPPKAVFNIDTQAGTVPLVLDFDASSSHDADGGIVEYSWRFADGETGEGIYVSHTYVQPGQYTAELTVTDDDGSTDTASIVITVTDISGQSERIIDNSDSAFSTVGNWKHSSSIPGYYDVDYQYRAPGTGSASANWTFEIHSNGVYEISVRWSSYENRAPDAKYSIFNNGVHLGDEFVDQTVNGGQFIPIANYSLLPF